MELLWQLQGVYISYKSLNNFHLYAIQLQQITTSADSYMSFTNNKTYQVWYIPTFFHLSMIKSIILCIVHIAAVSN